MVCRDCGCWGYSRVLLILRGQCEVTTCFSLSFSLLQVFTKYGKCYMFNSGEDGKPLLTTVKGGTGNGLEIMLDIQQDEYLPVWGETGMLASLGASSLGPSRPLWPQAQIGLHCVALTPSSDSSLLPRSHHVCLCPYVTSTLLIPWLLLPGLVTLQGNQASSSISGRHSLYK